MTQARHYILLVSDLYTSISKLKTNGDCGSFIVQAFIIAQKRWSLFEAFATEKNVTHLLSIYNKQTIKLC